MAAPFRQSADSHLQKTTRAKQPVGERNRQETLLAVLQLRFRQCGLESALGTGRRHRVWHRRERCAIPAKLMPPTSWLNRPDQSQDTIGIRHDVGKNRPRLLDPHEPTPVGMEGEPQLPLWPHTPPEP